MRIPRSRLARRSYDHVFCFEPSTPAGLEPHFLYSVCNGGLFSGVHQRWAQTCWTLVRICAWIGVAGYLHHRRWYWAI